MDQAIDLLVEAGITSALESYSLTVSFCSATFRCCNLDQLFTFTATLFF